MKNTLNYGLKKPEGTDVVNVEDINYNADIIDTKLKETESHLADMTQQIEPLINNISDIKQINIDYNNGTDDVEILTSETCFKTYDGMIRYFKNKRLLGSFNSVEICISGYYPKNITINGEFNNVWIHGIDSCSVLGVYASKVNYLRISNLEIIKAKTTSNTGLQAYYCGVVVMEDLTIQNGLLSPGCCIKLQGANLVYLTKLKFECEVYCFLYAKQVNGVFLEDVQGKIISDAYDSKVYYLYDTRVFERTNDSVQIEGAKIKIAKYSFYREVEGK